MVILPRILLLCVVVMAGGCLHTKHALTLHSDGSGILAVAYAVPEATLQMLGDSVGEQFDEDKIREDFAAKAAPGVRLTDVKVRDTDGGQAVAMKLEFDSLPDIARTEFYRESNLALQRTESGTYRFTQMPNAPRREPRTDEERKLMHGFQFTMEVTVPGTIVSTNADSARGGSATWHFDLDADPRALERMDTMVYEIVFTPAEPGLPEYHRPRVRLHPPAAQPPSIAGDTP